MKRLLAIIGFSFAALGALAVVVTGYVWVQYGKTNTLHPDQAAGTYSIFEYPESDTGIILFPANGIHPSQYFLLASDLRNALRMPVYVLSPTLRNEWFDSRIGTLPNGRVSNWILIGHSAGAAAACRDAESIQPKAIIAINGYCKHKTKVAVHAIGSTKDQLIPCAKVSRYHAQSDCIDAGGHFSITERSNDTSARALIIQTIERDIQENLGEAQP